MKSNCLKKRRYAKQSTYQVRGVKKKTHTKKTLFDGD